MPTAGQRILAQDFQTTVMDTEATTQSSISSASFSAGSPACELTFVAPTSGNVLMTVGGRIDVSSASDGVILEWELYLGTSAAGTLIVATGSWERRVELMASSGWSALQAASRSYLQTGLTPGATYYARVMHQGTANSNSQVISRSLIAQPLPA